MGFRKISIITPSLNRAYLLESAIQSVIAQNYPNYEHIIVDGGSMDSTGQVIQRYPELKFVSGPDAGMYDALNKGLEIATGEIIGFLNTDDLYAEKIFSEIAQKFDSSDVMAVAGRAIVFSELYNGEIEIVEKFSPNDMSLIESSTIGSNFFNAWFFCVSVFDKIGKFNAQYKVVGDRDFMLRFVLNGLKYEVMENLVYKYRKHGDSLTFDASDQNRQLSADEHLMMTSKYLNSWNVSKLERRLLVKLRTMDTVDMAARTLWKRDFIKFIKYSKEGIKYNLAWPLKFLQYIIIRGSVLIQRSVQRLF